MPDSIPAVGAQIQPPNPMQSINTMSGILGLQHQRVGLQQQQETLQSQTAEAQQAQQRNSELQRAQAVAIEGAKNGAYDDGNGGLDRQKMADDILRVAPTYGQPIIGQLLTSANEIMSNRQAHQNLNRSQQQQMGSTFGALATKPDLNQSDVIDSLSTLLQSNKDPGFQRMALSMSGSIPPNATGDQLRNIMRRWSIGATSPESAESQTAPAVSMVQGPKGLVPTNLQPQAPGGVGPVGPTQAQGIAPQIITNPLTGGPAVAGPGTGARPIGPGGSGGGAGGAPGGSNPFQPYPGQQADIQRFQGEVGSIRDQGDKAPRLRNINEQILRLADNSKTGPGTEIWQHAVGALGAPFGISPTANYQEIGKFLEQNAIGNMQSMGGPPSDARLSAAAAANGTTSFSPEALKAVTKFNNATNTGLMAYRQGIDRSVGMGQGVDYTKLPAFKAAWARNFDVDVFRAEDAIRDHDAGELAKIRAERGPQGMALLAQKRKNLALLSQGQMPQ